MQVEVADRVAELVRLRFVVHRLAGAVEFGLVLAELVLAGDLKEFFERLLFDAADALGGDEIFALGVLFDIAALDQHVDDVGVLFFPLLEILERFLPPSRACAGTVRRRQRRPTAE